MDAYRELPDIEEEANSFVVAVIAQERHDTFPSRVLTMNVKT